MSSEIQAEFKVYNVIDVMALLETPVSASFIEYLRADTERYTTVEGDNILGAGIATTPTNLFICLKHVSDEGAEEFFVVSVTWKVFGEWLASVVLFYEEDVLEKLNIQQPLLDAKVRVNHLAAHRDVFGFIHGIVPYFEVAYTGVELEEDEELTYYEPDEDLDEDTEKRCVQAIWSAWTLAFGTNVSVSVPGCYYSK